MLDGEAIKKYEKALKSGNPIEANTWHSLIILWGSDCCHGCENYILGKTITAHGYCPVHSRNVSPHFFCDNWEQD